MLQKCLLLCLGAGLLMGCQVNSLRGTWTSNDAAANPAEYSRMQFLENQTVLLGDGTSAGYQYPGASVVELKFANGEIHRFKFQRAAEGMSLADGIRTMNFSLQQ